MIEAGYSAMGLRNVIRAARVRNGWSQRKLARELGVAPSAVAQWELGDTMPAIAHRADLAKKLGVPFASLLPEAASASGNHAEADPQMLAIMQQVRKVPPPLREALLILISAAVESLSAASQTALPADINKN